MKLIVKQAPTSGEWFTQEVTAVPATSLSSETAQTTGN